MTTPMGHIDTCECPDCASRAAQMSPAAIMGVPEVEPQSQPMPARRARVARVVQRQPGPGLAERVAAERAADPGSPTYLEDEERANSNRQLRDIQRRGIEAMLSEIVEVVYALLQEKLGKLSDEQVDELAPILRQLHDSLVK